MSATPRNNRRTILYILLIGVVCILAVEALARMATRGPRWLNANYVEISRDFVELDALIADTQQLGIKYYDEYLYAPAPVTTELVNFTDYYSARLTPDSVPIEAAEHILWTFGGSTMENTETTDRLSIANTWARVFNQELGPSHVKNFGAGGFFSSYELIKFQKLLREVPQSELPTIAVFYDGYNDALYGFQYGPGSLQKDLSLKLQAFVEYNDFIVGTYSLSRMLAGYSKFWDRTGARVVEELFFALPEPNTETANLDASVRIYTSNVRMIQATCDAFSVQCYFILQPLIVTKQPLSQLEQTVFDAHEAHIRFGPEGTRFIRDFYVMAAEELAGNLGFIDASRILDGRMEPDFYDLGHTGVQTSPVIGERIAHMILERIDSIAGLQTGTRR